MAQAPLLTTTQEKQRNIDATWQVLIIMPQEQVDSLNHDAGSTDEQDIRGWLALRHVWSDNRGKPDGMKAGIRSWQKRWPQHPASEVQPSRLVRVMNFRSSSVSKIALMLPLSWQAARFGRVIYQGFEVGKYMSSPLLGGLQRCCCTISRQSPLHSCCHWRKRTVPRWSWDHLLKHHVRELLSSNTGVDVVALNLPEKPVFRDNVCYFLCRRRMRPAMPHAISVSRENAFRCFCFRKGSSANACPVCLRRNGKNGVVVRSWRSVSGR